MNKSKVSLNDMISFKQIRTPNYILTTASVNGESLKYHVSELTEEQVLALCDEFRENMVAKCRESEE